MLSSGPDRKEAPVTAVGFVGLGTMGSALSGRLRAAGLDVAGCDIDPARVTPHRARGGTVAASPADAAALFGVRGRPAVRW
jgi:3-hydroxyisobutyrate dehydrogenase-like beta-hydroxyacid dehydrogenase